MNKDVGRELHIDSDLRMQSGDLWARLVADGQHLRLVTNDPGRLLAQAASTPKRSEPTRATLQRLGNALDEVGLSAELVGERGRVVQFGRDCGSRTGRAITGSEHARLGSPLAVGSAAAGYARRAPALRQSALAAAAVIALVVAARRRGASRFAPVERP